MQPKRKCPVIIYLGVTSLLFLTAGIVLLCLWELLYNFIVGSNLILNQNSSAYKIWIRNPVPLSLKLYVFNWTNPEDIYNSSVKPRFRQLGPYVYAETKEKSNITWNSNDTVTFKHLKKWYFDPKSSNGSLSDRVTSINPVALSAAYGSRKWNYFFRKSFSLAVSTMINSSVDITKTVGEVLFDGYDDPLINMARSFPLIAGSNFPPMDKFGWFYGRNGSEDYEGTFNMDTGISGQLGTLYNWKYKNRTSYYEGTCGEFTNASAGEFFPTNLTKDTPIKFFSADLCRYVELEFEKEEIVNGILGYKYSAFDRFLDNGTKIPENKCFCDGDCMPYGALNVSACRYNSPAFVSLPHFHKADPYYRDIIEGLEPDEHQHDFFMTFEPKTGIPLKVSARLQLNLRVQSISGVTIYQDIPTAYFPVLWFEQVVAVPENMVFSVKLLVNFKVICWAISIISICVAALLQICMFYKLCAMYSFGKKKEPKGISREEVPLKKNKHM